MKIFSLSLLLAIVLFTCSSKKSFDHGHFSIGISKGILDNAEIDEASGLVASMVNPGMLWTHNDSGDEARLFLIDTTGKHRATVHLEGIENRDWEDIGIGPGPKNGVSYIYIGDIGDNLGIFPYKYIYRIEEPTMTQKGSQAADTLITQIDSIRFRLADKPRDSEALFVDPFTKHIYIFSKRESEQVNVYRLANNGAKADTMATLVTQIPYIQITAADITGDGTELLMKNYKNVYYWKRTSDEPIEKLLKKEPASLPYAAEPQGEAIAFDRAGRGYYTVSEVANHKRPHLMFYQRLNRSSKNE